MSQFLCYLTTIFFFTTTHGVHVRTSYSKHWDHAQNGRDWEGLCKVGKRQSPIELNQQSSIHQKLKLIEFWNYYQYFLNDSTLTNNGHSCSFQFGKTTEFADPHIGGANLEGYYIAEELHFHWGSIKKPGSEHLINGKKFDIEMHIVHRNKKYRTIEEAALKPNGLAVLGIMIDIVDNARFAEEHRRDITNRDSHLRQYKPGLPELFKLVPLIKDYKTVTKVASSVTMGSLLQNLNTNQYFTYQGSLTTPDCHESVHWIVFANSIQVKSSLANNLFLMRNLDRTNMVYNYRVIQPSFNRPIIFSS